MTTFSVSRRLAAEVLGTLLLVATVVGSGIMGAKLAGGNIALALLGNTIATGAVLVVLITLFGTISGAHFNPAVTLVLAVKREISAGVALAYMAAQVTGGVLGSWLAHAMFALPVLQLSATLRTGPGQWIAEFVATFGLLVTILLGRHVATERLSVLVGLYITAAYWFTASTSFANPAVTIARSLSNTFAGIHPSHVTAFVAMQLGGALTAAAVASWFLAGSATAESDR